MVFNSRQGMGSMQRQITGGLLASKLFRFFIIDLLPTFNLKW